MSDQAPGLKTYLPTWADARVLEPLRVWNFAAVEAALEEAAPYERVGLDRLIAIANDLVALNIRPPARVLDLGCNTGFFSIALGLMGYDVVGVDNNIAAHTQGWYPHPPLEAAARAKDQLRLATVMFVQADVAEYVAQPALLFDATLLLSVVHQWFEGYASTPEGRKPIEQIASTLRRVAGVTRHCVYYEGPEHETDAGKMALPLPAWFLLDGQFETMLPICASPSAFGDLRTVYRLSRRTLRTSEYC